MKTLAEKVCRAISEQFGHLGIVPQLVHQVATLLGEDPYTDEDVRLAEAYKAETAAAGRSFTNTFFGDVLTQEEEWPEGFSASEHIARYYMDHLSVDVRPFKPMIDKILNSSTGEVEATPKEEGSILGNLFGGKKKGGKKKDA